MYRQKCSIRLLLYASESQVLIRALWFLELRLSVQLGRMCALFQLPH